MNKNEVVPSILSRARFLVLAACYALMLNFLISSLLILEVPSLATLVIWLIQVLPLAIFMPSLHLGSLRSFAWVSFVILLYFMHGVLVAFNPASLIFGLIEAALCTIVFCALIVYIREYRRFYGVKL